MAELEIGDKAPDFELKDYENNLVRLSDYAGRTLIVYFYPAAMTPGCTVEATDFSKSRDELASSGFDVVGISPDPVDKLLQFRDKENLTVRLLADPEKEAVEAYGVWGTRKLYGKDVEGIIRSTFVIEVDQDGVGTIKDIQRNVRAKGHVQRLSKSLGVELQI